MYDSTCGGGSKFLFPVKQFKPVETLGTVKRDYLLIRDTNAHLSKGSYIFEHDELKRIMVKG
jgi:hypothetical protein